MSALAAQIERAWPVAAWRDVTCLIAISGGADSVALLRGLVELRRSTAGEGKLLAAHFNHALRGAESDGDEAFVVDLCRHFGVQLFCERAGQDLTTCRNGEGLEGAARAARYAFLTQAADRAGARYVATAHTADDQAETILQRVIRGAGLAGLAGIPKFRPLSQAATLVRPLLEATRADVLAYLSEQQQSYRDDSSNASREFTRNRTRRELLPLLEHDYNPQVRASLLRLATIADQTEVFLNRLADQILAEARQPCDGGLVLLIERLAQADPVLVRQALLRGWTLQGWPLADMGFDQWRLMQQMALEEGSPAARTFPGQIQVAREAGVLRMTFLG